MPGASGKSLNGRRGLLEALQAVESGDGRGARRREARPALSGRLLDFAGADGTGTTEGLEPRRARPGRRHQHAERAR